MLTNNRDAYRKTFIDAWQKHQQQQPLEALEKQIVEVIHLHPEMQPLLTDNIAITEFSPAENPFIHLSLHMAIREQIRLDHPKGIHHVYETLTIKLNDAISAEHQMIDCLANLLWEMQKTGEEISDGSYLNALQNL